MTVIDGSRTAPGVRSWLLNADAQVLASDGDLLIRRGDRVSRCRGAGGAEFLAALLSAMDGNRIDLDPAALEPGKLHRIADFLAKLAEAGLFAELPGPAAADHPPAVLGLWTRCGGTVSAEKIGEALTGRSVQVTGRGLLAEQVRETCREAGLTLADDASDAPVAARVLIGSHADDTAFASWNRRAIAAADGIGWLAVTPFDGVRATVGPWLVPGESACYRCYLLRRASTFPGDAVAAQLADAEPIPTGADGSAWYPGVARIQAGMVADLLLEHVGLGNVSGRTAPGALTAVTVGREGVSLDRHRVLRVPRCPECSPARGRGYPQVWFANQTANAAVGAS